MRSDKLQRRYGMTPAEADLALEILKGDGRAAAAARIHLQRVFHKTGVHRQFQ